jgi:hypothetical protein
VRAELVPERLARLAGRRRPLLGLEVARSHWPEIALWWLAGVAAVWELSLHRLHRRPQAASRHLDRGAQVGRVFSGYWEQDMPGTMVWRPAIYARCYVSVRVRVYRLARRDGAKLELMSCLPSLVSLKLALYMESRDKLDVARRTLS